ncbi:MAG TPA: hypothetical protein V6C65_40130 [Allocoleopsis sp.]
MSTSNNQARNQTGAVSLNFLSLLRQRLQNWIRQEIVDDDPWDEPSLLNRRSNYSRSADFRKIDRDNH